MCLMGGWGVCECWSGRHLLGVQEGLMKINIADPARNPEKNRPKRNSALRSAVRVISE